MAYKYQLTADEIDALILDAVDPDYLELPADADHDQTVAALARCYWAEIGHWAESPHVPRALVIRDWLQGLPSALHLAFTYEEIAGILRDRDVRTPRPRRDAGIADQQDRAYWRPIAGRLSVHFTRAFDGRAFATTNR